MHDLRNSRERLPPDQAPEWSRRGHDGRRAAARPSRSSRSAVEARTRSTTSRSRCTSASGRHVVRVEQKDRFRWGPIQITWGGDFECRVTCPPGTDLEFAGGSTDLRVEGELGEVVRAHGVRRHPARSRLRRRSAGEDGERRHLGRRRRGRGVARDRLGRSRCRACRCAPHGARRSRATSRSAAIAGPLGFSTTSGDVDLRAVRAATCASSRSRATFASGSRVGRESGSMRRRSRDASSPSSGLDDQEPPDRDATTASSRCMSRPSAATCRSFAPQRPRYLARCANRRDDLVLASLDEEVDEPSTPVAKTERLRQDS